MQVGLPELSGVEGRGHENTGQASEHLRLSTGSIPPLSHCPPDLSVLIYKMGQ